MKKIYLFLLTAVISAGSFAQTVLIADNPGASNFIVIGNMANHASESIYTEAEIGAGNFITAGSAIQQVFFFMNTEGLTPTVNNFSIYMKNVPLATTAFTDGTYSLTGYSLVFSGTFNATPAGFVGVSLTAPFTRTAGTNLQILIIRADGVTHTGNGFDAAIGNNTSALVNSTRRYNGAAVPAAGVSSLVASTFRPLIAFIHTFPVDAGVNGFDFPTASCYTTPQNIGVEILNDGTTNIAAGAASTTLRIRGANTFTGTQANTAVILPGATELITFTGINLNNLGTNFDTAFVTLAGDGTTYNDTLTTESGVTLISTFPAVEDVEGNLPVFPFAQGIFGDRQLWTLWGGDYLNGDMILPLSPRLPGDSFYIFDSYSGDDSEGFESRLYSNCIDLTTATGALITFWMSHDDVFDTSLDSLYVSVSTDRGQSWTRLTPGFQRPDITAVTPVWRMESVNLNAYIGQTIQVAFEGVSKWGNVIGLDDITISATLPISLLEFNAQRTGSVNKLTWKTSQEANSNKFVIERSTDGTRFLEIGQVAAAGNSNTVRNYSFTDLSPVKGINYYRLRLVDNDNAFKYSTVKNVRNLGSADFSFAPNPVQQHMYVKIDADKADKGTLTITDISGRQVYNQAMNVVAGTNNISIETGKLAPGSYVIKMQLSDDRIVKKFNKL